MVTRYRLASVGTAALLAAGLLVAAGPPSSAIAPEVGPSPTAAVPSRIVRACVNRSTGAIRIIRRGKCRSGEKRIRWSTSGPVGPAGPVGPQGPTGPRGYTPIVRDATGAVVPDVLFVYSSAIARLIGTGVYYYWYSGQVEYEPIESAYYRFLGGTCSGPMYVASYNQQIPGGYERMVVRGTDRMTLTTYGYSASVVAVAAGVAYSYYVEAGGVIVCAAATTSSADDWRALTSLGAAPPSLPGPLTLSFS